MYLIFDTETTGLPQNKSAPITDLDNWPRLVQLAWQLHASDGKLIASGNYIVRPMGFTIPYNAQKIHGISTEKALDVGQPLTTVLEAFSDHVKKAQTLVGHNIEFDNKIIGAEYLRVEHDNLLAAKDAIDTAQATKDFCQLPGGPGGGLKVPRLAELYEKLFATPMQGAHDAAYDVDATAKSFFESVKRKIIELPHAHTEAINYESPNLDSTNFAWIRGDTRKDLGNKHLSVNEIKGPFCHLHVHSQFSVLQAVPDVPGLIAKAKAYNMPAVALTDLGNLFGAFKFVQEAIRQDIKPVVGAELFVAEERLKTRFTKDNPDKRFQQVLLAKNRTGYANLSQLSSLGYMEGLYGLYPRVDRELIRAHREGLIALSGGLAGEIPSLILNVGEHQAEEALNWWLEVFQDDFYIELNRHGLEEEDHLNGVLTAFAEKYNVPILAANELFYLEEEDWKAQDILLCIKENEKQSTPIGRGRGFRPGMKNHSYYFKTQEEMKRAFTDLPEAIENIPKLLEKIEVFPLERDVLLPAFDIPEDFRDQKDLKDGGKRGENAYLRHLTYQGAATRYQTITHDIRERIDFELRTIEKTGYPGYFLIVQDLTSKAREMGVAVGPGRGSAAGSVVAYCTGITNVDPIAYNLLFERFLNPDRISLPDIDIDFDNEGRDKVLQYVIDKYGFNQVAQIITYGTMAPKSAIRDAGRVMELPLPETDTIAKLIPERPGTKFANVFQEIKELAGISQGQGLPAQVLNQAVVLEGSLRNIGIHACGVIITPQPLTELIPVARSKDSELLLTQFDNSVVESAGMLKMDFLGLRTLSIIRTTIENVEKRHGVRLDIDSLPLDDAETYALYQRGETNGTFQFESPGMQKHLRALKPDRFQDLIAMNALYRPGPMEYIPNFIARKHGKESISYDLKEMEEFLAETYGITVYQEQVMLLSQKIAGFTKGQADSLRKGMGKKKKAIIDELKPKFFEGGEKNGHPREKLEKIWRDWEAFAAYAFNKSHSTCYSVIAYQTAYLKANYPAEYMASVLTHNQSNSDKVSFFMEECRNLGIKVLGPHVNESGIHFEVNEAGEIRFGLGAIKGTGESAIQAVIEEREANGPFTDIFDFTCRVNLRAVNKKSLECLAKAGGFDCFQGFHRRQYVDPDAEGSSLIEKSIRFAQRVQQDSASAQASLFGNSDQASIQTPKVGQIEPYGEIERLNIEKEMVGLYISGHPLDQYRFEMEFLTNAKIADLHVLKPGRKMSVGGIVTEVQHRVSKTGKPFGQFTLEDFSDNHTFFLFSTDYLQFKPMLEKGWFLYVTGTVQPRWKGDELEFKIQQIEHLSEIREKMTRSVELQIHLDELNGMIIEEVEEMCNKHPGKLPLRLSVLAAHQDRILKLDTLSRKYTINVSESLIKAIEGIQGLGVKVRVE